MHFSTSPKSQLDVFNLLNYSKEKYALRYPKEMVGFSGSVICLIRSPGFGILYQNGGGIRKITIEITELMGNWNRNYGTEDLFLGR